MELRPVPGAVECVPQERLIQAPCSHGKLAWICCDLATKSGSRAGNVPAESRRGQGMAEQISPAFHAEIIVVFFNEYRDLRRVKERAGVLLSGASAEHLEAVGQHLPEHLVHVLPSSVPRAA
jgi:hypothetical protein